MSVFITSDTHYAHKNICSATTEWKEGFRVFPSLEAMNKTIVDNINNMVGANDVLWHLGDWSFGGYDNIRKFREQINCKNIFLVFGNHDSHILIDKKNELRKLFNKVYYSYWTGNIEGQNVTLCHYNMNVWDRSHHQAWHFWGHSHASLPDNPYKLELEVGVDCVYNLYRYREEEFIVKSDTGGRVAKYFYGDNPQNPELLFYHHDLNDRNNTPLNKPLSPFHMDTIAEIMKLKSWNQVDHHNKETN